MPKSPSTCLRLHRTGLFAAYLRAGWHEGAVSECRHTTLSRLASVSVLQSKGPTAIQGSYSHTHKLTPHSIPGRTVLACVLFWCMTARTKCMNQLATWLLLLFLLHHLFLTCSHRDRTEILGIQILRNEKTYRISASLLFCWSSSRGVFDVETCSKGLHEIRLMTVTNASGSRVKFVWCWFVPSTFCPSNQGSGLSKTEL